MSISNSRQAYTDCYKAYDAAVASELGVKVRVVDYNAAVYFRMRCNQARRINRQDNAEEYPVGDPMHNASVYDRIVIRIRKDEDDWYVYFEHVGLDMGEIVPIESKADLPQAVSTTRVEAEGIQIEPVRRRL